MEVLERICEDGDDPIRLRSINLGTEKANEKRLVGW